MLFIILDQGIKNFSNVYLSNVTKKLVIHITEKEQSRQQQILPLPGRGET